MRPEIMYGDLAAAGLSWWGEAVSMETRESDGDIGVGNLITEGLT